MDDVFELISARIGEGGVTFYFDPAREKKCCLIGDMVFYFSEADEGSLVVEHQNLTLICVRETVGWADISRCISAIEVNEDYDDREEKRVIFRALIARLKNLG
jgi:hypothetical protein